MVRSLSEARALGESTPISRGRIGQLAAVDLVCPDCRETSRGMPGQRCLRDGAALCLPANMPTKPDPMLGTVLAGRYPIIGLLGRGGMGSVYCAVQEPLGRRVAVKVIRTETVSPEDIPMLRKRFAREAHATAALNHPTIVGLFDYGEVDEDELLFMVMEQVDGLSLRQVLRTKKRLPVALAVDLTDQVLSALQHAHEQGVVHRDLKPANIMVVGIDRPMPRAKLLDFGVAKVFADLPGQDATVGTTASVGTPRYMAPEQIVNEGVGPAADIYAMGIVLYICLTGQPPFDGPTDFHICEQHRSAPVPAMAAELGVPAELEAVVRWALEKRPENRPISAAVFAEALREAARPGSVDTSSARRTIERLILPPTLEMSAVSLPEAEPADETSGHGESHAAPQGQHGASLGTQSKVARLAVPLAAAVVIGAGVLAWRMADTVESTPVATGRPEVAAPAPASAVSTPPASVAASAAASTAPPTPTSTVASAAVSGAPSVSSPPVRALPARFSGPRPAVEPPATARKPAASKPAAGPAQVQVERLE